MVSTIQWGRNKTMPKVHPEGVCQKSKLVTLSTISHPARPAWAAIMRIQEQVFKFEMWVRSGENNRITSESKQPPSPSCPCWHRSRSQGSVILSYDWSRAHNTQLWLVRGDHGYSENSDRVVGTMLGGSMLAHLQHIQISLTTNSSVWNLNPGIQYFEWAITSLMFISWPKQFMIVDTHRT